MTEGMQRFAAIVGLAALLLAADPAIAGPPEFERLSWPPEFPSFAPPLRCVGLFPWIPLELACNDTRFSSRARVESQGRAPELRSGH